MSRRRRRSGLLLLARRRRRAARRLVLRLPGLPGLPRQQVAVDLPAGPRSWGPR